MTNQNRLIKYVVTTAVLLGSGNIATSNAAEMGMAAPMSTGTINIMSPKDGGEVYVSKDNAMEYDITLGAGGDDHFHVWIDGEKGPAQHALKGSYALPKMTPGKHTIIVKIVDKAHVPTGPEKTIFVKAE